jgi:DNA-binding phage protein
MFDMGEGLRAAAENGQLDIVKHLIKYLMDEEEHDYYGALSGALEAASRNNKSEVVKYLIDNQDFDQNASINPLFNLAKNGNSELFKKLYGDKKFLAYGLNTMLSFAAEGGSLDIVKYLIDEKGAKDIEGALAPAEKYNHKDVIDYLQQKLKKIKDFYDASLSGDVEKFKNLTDIDFKDKHILNAALRNVSLNGDPTIDHLNVVKHLVEKGADAFSDAIWLAAEAGNLDLVKYFVEEKGVEGLDYALVAASDSKSKNTKNIVKTIKYLISKGGTDRIEDALKKATLRGNLDIIKTLIDETDGVFSDEALYSSCWQGNFEVVKYLIQREKYSNDVLQTAISYAKKHKEIADYIKNILSSDA